MLREELVVLRDHSKSPLREAGPDEFWTKIQEQGGWWSDEVPNPPLRELLTVRQAKSRPKPEQFWWRTSLSASLEDLLVAPPPMKPEDPQFDGSESEYPFYFLPFQSQAFADGSLAHLPWLQEMPDPLSTAMWGTWVEINPQTAERLGIRQGDLVEVASQHGKLQAPALVTPGIAPDVVAMPVGQGHTNYTRYASGRGANPMSILAPMVVPETGSLAWAATRVKISKIGEGKLALFAGGMREHPHEHR
jgi:anaerobic selenocysteine-containing dehydrogenase